MNGIGFAQLYSELYSHIAQPIPQGKVETEDHGIYRDRISALRDLLDFTATGVGLVEESRHPGN